MALLFLLLLTAFAWALGAVQLWVRARWAGEALVWLGGMLALGVAACIAWGFMGLLRHADWQALSTGQAVQRWLGSGSSWFQRTGWLPLDRISNAYLTMDLVWTLVALCAASAWGYVFWAGVAEHRRQARVRRIR
ncbi:MAG TPA: hypothetical protein VLK29_02250 [Luteimonas sp.]|nr:hypothetical protein [Luteimonas sp.]